MNFVFKICLSLLVFLCLNLQAEEDVLLVGIAGGSGSGKSTVTQLIKDQFAEEEILILSQDSYYRDQSHLPMEKREQINYDHPDALEFSLLREHLISLKQGKEILQPHFDFVTHTRTSHWVVQAPKRVIIVEGILLLALPEVRELFDVKFYVDTDDDIRLIRRLQRDMADRGRSLDQVIEQYVSTVRPMHELFVEPSKRYADLILPWGGRNLVGVDLIVSKLKEF